MTKLTEYVCQCDACKGMCERAPCHGTPKEMQAIIDAGYGDRLWVNDQWDTEMVYIKPLPSPDSLTGGWVDLHGRCPFYRDGLCELHDKGLKPLEGRTAIHAEGAKARGFYLRQGIAKAWRKPYGQFVLKRFNEQDAAVGHTGVL